MIYKSTFWKSACLFILFICFSYIDIYSQNTLLLHCPANGKRFFYKIGDPISLRTTMSITDFQGVITAIGDTSLVLNSFPPIAYSNILKVRKPRAFVRIFSPYKIAAAGVVYPLMSATNRAINNESPLLGTLDAVVASSSFSLAVILSGFKTRSFSIGKWRLKAIDL